MSLITGIVFTLLVSVVIDRFKSLNQLESGFLFIACAMLVISICDTCAYLLIRKEDADMHASDSVPLKTVFKETMNRNFRNVVYLSVVYNCAQYSLVGFIGMFKNSMLPSLFFVQIINMLANFARIGVSLPLGKYSDKNGFAKGFMLGICFLAVAYLCIVFTGARTWYLIIGYTIFVAVSQAATGQNFNNITYSYVPAAYISQAMTFKNSIGGLCGFLISVIASKLVQLAGNDNRITVLGMHLYSQQLLAVFGLLFIAISILILRKIAKQTALKQ